MTPDAGGNFKGIAVPADGWERAFGGRRTIVVCESCLTQQCARGELVCDNFLTAAMVNVLAPAGAGADGVEEAPLR